MKKADTFKVVKDILGGKWLVSYPSKMLPLALDYLSRLPVRMDIESPDLLTIFSAGDQQKGYEPSKEQRIVIVPLHGTMTKYETCTSWGTTDLAAKLKSMANDDSVVGVILDIDSGGGSASAVPPLIEAISYFKSKSKPIIAHCDLCGSAAYWVACQCDAIYMDNSLSEVGSIGALVCLVDNSAANPSTGEKLLTIYARESDDKNKSYREALEGRYTLMQDELSPLVKEFQNSVIKCRPHLHKNEKGVLSGAMFLSADAIRLGMADAQKTLDETIAVVFALADI